jgi:hypothetical protein
VSDLTASPPRYAPVRHPGVPRRWGRAAIADALRAWAAETGGQPRRQDWSLDEPANGRGGAPDDQHGPAAVAARAPRR